MNTTTENTGSWNNSLSLNIEVIDNQHKNFFRLFDELLLINSEEADREVKIAPIIAELQEYAEYHLNTEEGLMKQSNWEDIDSHIKQHNLFRKKCNDFQIEHIYKSKVLLEEMVSFLRKWFMSHISEVDAAYAETVRNYLSKKGEY